MAINIENYAALDRTDEGDSYLRLMEHREDGTRIIVDANNQLILQSVSGWEDYSLAVRQLGPGWIYEDLKDHPEPECAEMIEGIERTGARLHAGAKVAHLLLHPLHTDASIVVLNNGTVWADMEFGLWRNYPLIETAMVAVDTHHA